MAKTRADIIQELIVLGHDEGTLEELKKAELEAILKEAKQKDTEEEVNTEKEVNQGEHESEPTVNEKEEVNQDESTKSDDVICDALGEVICESTIKLRVHDTRVISLYAVSKAIKVENLGGGDAYVSGDVLRLSSTDVLRPGEERVITGTKAIIVRASSRPTLKVTQYK